MEIKSLFSGNIKGYDIIVGNGFIWVGENAGRKAQVHRVPNYGTDILDLMRRPGAALGWARMPDDEEILYFYDKNDDNFGYALNLDTDYFSEWGYAPFEVKGR
jgi:hypothetical protein